MEVQSIEEKIKQRRLQILIHSCIYYEFNENIISDFKYNEWSKELVSLQNQYPEIAEKVEWSEEFKDFDGSTGFDLPKDGWVKEKAKQLLDNRTVKTNINKTLLKEVPKRKSLF